MPRIANGDCLTNFDVDSISGIITAKTEFNHEATPSFECRLLAIDNGTPPRTGTASHEDYLNTNRKVSDDMLWCPRNFAPTNYRFFAFRLLVILNFSCSCVSFSGRNSVLVEVCPDDHFTVLRRSAPSRLCDLFSWLARKSVFRNCSAVF